MKKNITTSESIERREFRFSRNNVNLSFSLRIDIKQELKDFLELLKAAQEAVEREISKK